ncbi:MAG: hypothetical protein ISN29_06050, partial [Gammaproteobacteria bacterium AqS3]|nr:hypothetical protein [Gammaproteobacteria bacterium AqS3]
SLSSGQEARGSVVLWADGGTRFSGSVTTGPQGFVEVSGKRHLIYAPEARVDAPSLLLDPSTIVLTDGDQKGWLLSESQELSANWSFAPLPESYSQLHVHGRAEGELARPDYAMTLGLPIFESAAASAMQLALRADVISVTGTILLNQGAAGAINTLTLSADGSIVFAPNATLMGGQKGLRRLSLDAAADITLGSGALIQTSLADVHRTGSDAVDRQIPAGLIWISVGARAVFDQATVEAGHLSIAADHLAMSGGALRAWGSAGILTGDSGNTGSIRPAHLWMSARSIDVTGGGADISDAILVGENFRYILGARDAPIGSSEFLLGSVQLMAAEGIALKRGAASGRISLSGGGAVSLSSGEALDAQGLLLTAGGLDLNAGGALNIELHSLHASGSASLSGGGSIGLTGSAGVSLLASAGWGISADGDIFFTETGASAGDLSGLTLEAGGSIEISAGGSVHLGVLSAGVADASLGSGAREIVQMAEGRAGEIDNRLLHVSVTAAEVLKMAGAGSPSSVVLGAATVHFSGGHLSAGVQFLLSGTTLVRSSATVESSGEISIQAHTVQLSAPLMAESVAVSGTSLLLGNMTALFRDVEVMGTSLSLSGTVSAMRNLILQAEESIHVASGASLLAGQSVQISAGSAVQLSASVVLSAFGDVSLLASETLVLGQSISLDSGNQISVGGASSGVLIGSAAVLQGKEFDWSGSGMVSVQAGATLSASDQITVLAAGGIWLDASVSISAANAMTLDNSQTGRISAGDAAQLLVASGGLLLRNRSGPIELGSSVLLSVQSVLQLASDSDSIAIGDATLSGDSILLSAGAIRAGGDLSLLGRTLVQIAGSVTATGTVRVDSPHTVHLSGEVEAAAVRISASIATVQKLIATGQDISLTAATVEIQTGGLSAKSQIYLRAGGPLNVSLDAMSAGSGMTLSSGGSVALIGRSAVEIDVDLLVRAGSDIRRIVPGSAGGERGRLTVAGSAHFSAGGEVALPGLSVSGKLTVDAARITVQDMIGGDVMLLSAPSITLAQGGARAQAGGDLSLDFTELVGTVAGTLSSARGAVALRGRPISFGADLTIHAATSLTFDARRAGGANPVSALISVSGSANISTGGQVSLDRLSASGDLTVQGGSIDIRRIESGASVQLQADFITLKHVLTDDDISLSFSQLFGSLKATLSSSQGSIVFLGDTLSVKSSLTAHAAADISHSGLMHADSVVEFRAGASIDLATLSVDGRLLAVAGSLLQLDTVSGAAVMGLAAPEISLGSVLANSHLDVSFSTLRGAGEITLSSRRRLSIEGSGRISVIGTLHLLARRNIDISADILEVDSALTVSTGRALYAGTISTGGNLSLRGGDIHAMHLDIGGWGRLSADGLISVSSGGIVAAGALSLEAISLSHSGASTQTLGEINIYRSISAGGSLWMHAHEMRLSDTVVAAEIAMSGNTIYASTISSDGNLSLRGQSIQAVSLDAGGWGKVSVERLLTIFPGGIRTGDSLSLDAPLGYSLVPISISESSSILTVGAEINVQGSISAGGSLWMHAHEMRLSDTVMAAEIAMSGNTIYAGTISSDGNLSLRGQSIQAVSLDAGGWGKVSVEDLLTIFPGGIRTGDSLSLDALSLGYFGGAIDIQGTISSGGSLWMQAHEMEVSDTVVAAAITMSGNSMHMSKTLAAESGDFTIHVSRQFNQTGGISAGNDLSIIARGNLNQSGGMTAGNDIYFRGDGTIRLSQGVLGIFTPGRDMTMHSFLGDILLGDHRDAPINVPGTLRLIAGNAVRTSLDATLNPDFKSATLRINGPLSLNAGTSIQMDALLVQGALNAESDGTVQFGHLSGGASVSLSAGETITAGSVTVAGDARLTAVSEITLGDAASVGGSALLRAGQSVQVRADFSAGAITVTAAAYISAAGSVSASGQIQMSATWVQLAGNAAGGAVSISAFSLTLQQVLASGGDVSLIGLDTLSWQGGVSASGDIYVLGGGALDIGYSTISAGGSMTLSSTGESVALIGAADAPLRLGGDLTIHASGDLIRIVPPQLGPSGLSTTLSSGGSVQISAGGSVSLGTLLAGGSVHVSASESVNLREISSGGGVSVSSGEGVGVAGSVSAAGVIHISGGQISIGRPALGAAITLSGSTLDIQRLSAASGDISLIGRERFTQAGGLHAHRNIDIRVGTALDISYDQISAGGSIFLSAGGGSIAFIGARSDRLTFQGDLTALASGDVLRRISDLDTSPTGPDTTLTANGRVSISAGGDIRLGVLKVQSTLHLQAADVIDLKGVSAGAEADVSAGGSVRISGAASVSRAVRLSASVLRFDEPLTAGSISIRGQTLTAQRLSASSGDLSVVARAAFTQAGGLYAHRNIDIRVGTALDISYDQISAGGSIF